MRNDKKWSENGNRRGQDGIIDTNRPFCRDRFHFRSKFMKTSILGIELMDISLEES